MSIPYLTIMEAMVCRNKKKQQQQQNKNKTRQNKPKKQQQQQQQQNKTNKKSPVLGVSPSLELLVIYNRWRPRYFWDLVLRKNVLSNLA